MLLGPKTLRELSDFLSCRVAAVSAPEISEPPLRCRVSSAAPALSLREVRCANHPNGRYNATPHHVIVLPGRIHPARQPVADCVNILFVYLGTRAALLGSAFLDAGGDRGAARVGEISNATQNE